MHCSSICMRGSRRGPITHIRCLSDGGLGGVGGVFSVWHLHIQAS